MLNKYNSINDLIHCKKGKELKKIKNIFSILIRKYINKEEIKINQIINLNLDPKLITILIDNCDNKKMKKKNKKVNKNNNVDKNGNKNTNENINKNEKVNKNESENEKINNKKKKEKEDSENSYYWQKYANEQNNKKYELPNNKKVHSSSMLQPGKNADKENKERRGLKSLAWQARDNGRFGSMPDYDDYSDNYNPALDTNFGDY